MKPSEIIATAAADSLGKLSGCASSYTECSTILSTTYLRCYQCLLAFKAPENTATDFMPLDLLVDLEPILYGQIDNPEES